MSNDEINNNMSNEENDNVSNEEKINSEQNDNVYNEENEEKINPEQNDKLHKLQNKIDTIKNKNTLNNEKIKSDHVKTPKCLANKRIIINPQTNDNKFFMDAVTLSLYCKSIGKNNTRPKNIRKYNDAINCENINFSPTGQDCKQLEANDENVKLSVLELNNKEKFDHI